jgi:type II secretory pathway pseudopilin PulG
MWIRPGPFSLKIISARADRTSVSTPPLRRARHLPATLVLLVALGGCQAADAQVATLPTTSAPSVAPPTSNGLAVEQEAVAKQALAEAAAKAAADQAAAAEAARVAAEQAAAETSRRSTSTGGTTPSKPASRPAPAPAPARAPVPAPAPVSAPQQVGQDISLHVSSCSTDGTTYDFIFSVTFSDGHTISGLHGRGSGPHMYNLYMDYGGRSMFVVTSGYTWACPM